MHLPALQALRQQQPSREKPTGSHTCFAQALQWLLTAPGASRTVLDARAPYAMPAVEQLLGHAPARFASHEAAAALPNAAA